VTPLQDHFVGFVAAAFGCYLLFGATLDAPWLMTLKHPRLLSESIGKNSARWTLASIGLVVIVMGGLIARGWRIDWSGTTHDAASSAPAARGS
jgi:hypothetical protein